MRQIMIEAPKHGCRLFRNNCGFYETAAGHKIRYGVANPGGADLIGWTFDGAFLAVEVKKPANSRAPWHQLQFLQAVRDAGGVAGICRSVEDFVKLIESA